MLREWEESFRELELELAPPLLALLGSEVCSLLWDWPFFFPLSMGEKSVKRSPVDRYGPWRKLDLGLVAFGVPSAPKASVLQ